MMIMISETNSVYHDRSRRFQGQKAIRKEDIAKLVETMHDRLYRLTPASGEYFKMQDRRWQKD